jgi:putative FmdB family regulatory protein
MQTADRLFGRSTAMPTYEYSCTKCGKTFEAYQSMRDDSFKICPKELCRMSKWGRGRVKRLVGTGAGLIFKGSGFYTTDYRSHSYTEGAKKDAPVAPDSGAKKASGTKDAVTAKPPASGADKKPNKN